MAGLVMLIGAAMAFMTAIAMVFSSALGDNEPINTSKDWKSN